MKKKKHAGRIPLVVRKQTDFVTQCREGFRQPKAYWASIFLGMLARRTKPLKKTGTVADWFLNYCIEAWKKSDAKYFKDIASTVERGTENVHANPAAYKLWAYFLEHPLGHEEKSRIFSIAEIRQICDNEISERTAGRFARDLGLKIRHKGAHGKKWKQTAKVGT